MQHLFLILIVIASANGVNLNSCTEQCSEIRPIQPCEESEAATIDKLRCGYGSEDFGKNIYTVHARRTNSVFGLVV